MNVFSPNHAFDWRISVSTEEPSMSYPSYPKPKGGWVELTKWRLVDLPDSEAELSREKDRLCYTHQSCQVDLTAVTQKVGHYPLWTPELIDDYSVMVVHLLQRHMSWK